MGLEAVKSAFNQSYRLGDKHAAARLLTWMAFNVLDEPRGDKPALTFFAGYATAAQGLGFRLADLDDPKNRAAALTAVKRTMRVLKDAQLITRISRSAPGRTAEWRLTLDPVKVVDNSPARSNRGGLRITTGVEDRPVHGSKTDPLGVEDRPVHGSVIDLDSGRSSTPLSEGPNPPERTELIGRALAHARDSKGVA